MTVKVPGKTVLARWIQAIAITFALHLMAGMSQSQPAFTTASGWRSAAPPAPTRLVVEILTLPLLVR
jgi:hypothetical protein